MKSGTQRFRDELLSAVKATEAVRPAAVALLGRSITVALITNVMIEIFWVMLELFNLRVGYWIYSTQTVLQVLFAIALALRVIDMPGLFGIPWIRVWPLVILVFALAVFNATAVQSGKRIAFGFPALPAGLLKPSLAAIDVDPDLEIDLADAVRLSANFPYGFEYAVLGDGKQADENSVTRNAMLCPCTLL